jgi:SAM-dependent methyltransferase
MGSPYLSPYEDPAAHARVSALIRRHSSNPEDVRRAMLRSLDLGDVEEILDLGCGFGFWAEALAEEVAPTARFTGLDACDRNESSYLRTVRSTGRGARFLCADLEARIPFRDHSFDLVIAAYSLYFFVPVIPDVARVIRCGGHFLAVTHSEQSFAGLLRAVGLPVEEAPLMSLLRGFSSENGEGLLRRSFSSVRRVDYRNSLSFAEKDREDLLAYLRFKLPLLGADLCDEDRWPKELELRAAESLRRSGRVLIRKDDTLFICGVSDDG